MKKVTSLKDLKTTDIRDPQQSLQENSKPNAQKIVVSNFSTLNIGKRSETKINWIKTQKKLNIEERENMDKFIISYS